MVRGLTGYWADPLATRAGRLLSFFLLYVSEGIPLGFTATVIATHMRREGVDPAVIGAYVGSLYLPWAFKWVFGPIIDTITSDTFGRRRTWIVGAQIAMMLALLAAMPIDFATATGLFTAVIFVAQRLRRRAGRRDRRARGAGVAGRGTRHRERFHVRRTVGGPSGRRLRHSADRCVAAVRKHVLHRGRNDDADPRRRVVAAARTRGDRNAVGRSMQRDVGRWTRIARELRDFVRAAWRAFVGTRAASLGVLFAALPLGSYALSLSLQSNLAVELGLGDEAIGTLGLWSSLMSALGCVVGGWMSDRYGRRRMIALFVALTALPTVWLALVDARGGTHHAGRSKRSSAS